MGSITGAGVAFRWVSASDTGTPLLPRAPAGGRAAAGRLTVTVPFLFGAGGGVRGAAPPVRGTAGGAGGPATAPWAAADRVGISSSGGGGMASG